MKARRARCFISSSLKRNSSSESKHPPLKNDPPLSERSAKNRKYRQSFASNVIKHALIGTAEGEVTHFESKDKVAYFKAAVFCHPTLVKELRLDPSVAWSSFPKSGPSGALGGPFSQLKNIREISHSLVSPNSNQDNTMWQHAMDLNTLRFPDGFIPVSA